MSGLTVVSGSRQAAEDAVQEALARAWERSERGNRVDSLEAWVTTVALNLLRSGLRRRRVEREARHRLRSVTTSPSVDDRLDVRRAVGLLPRRQREVTVLRYYLDMDVAAIARALGIREGTAKALMFQARQSLARTLGVHAEPMEVNDRADP